MTKHYLAKANGFREGRIIKAGEVFAGPDTLKGKWFVPAPEGAKVTAKAPPPKPRREPQAEARSLSELANAQAAAGVEKPSGKLAGKLA